MNTDTPRTDEVVNDTALENKNHPHTDWVTAHFARQLERELSQWRKMADRLVAVIEAVGYVSVEGDEVKVAREALDTYNKLKGEHK